jgi:Ni,Fe-hydrogenase III large subunit
VFYLSYHLHWSHEEIMELDIAERRAFIRLLAEEIERQNQSFENARPKR